MARQWMKFFLDAGVPKESAAEYAVNFEANRMELDMLGELDKDCLRDLSITAMGDIIAILRHSRLVASKLKKSPIDKKKTLLDSPSPEPEKAKTPPPSSTTSSASTRVIKEPTQTSPRKVIKKSAAGVSSRLGPPKSKHEKVEEDTEDAEDTNKSVFRRLGSQHQSPQPQPKAQTEDKSPNKNIFQRLGPGAEKQKVASVSEERDSVPRESRSQSPQEARVSSTSSEHYATGTPGKGILKKRGTGSGTAMSKSISAPNIVSLKSKPVESRQDKKEKRISFGHDEIRFMEASPGIKSRLGYGRGSSPPPPELDSIDDPAMQTELKKIAVGGGKFEIKRVMKVVNEMNKSTLRDSVTPERSASDKTEEFYVPMRSGVKTEAVKGNPLKISIKNDEYKKRDESEYNVDKVDLALRAAKLKSNLDQRRGEHSSSSSSSSVISRKRLVKIETLADGSKVKSVIDEDDPILATIPVKRSKREPSEDRDVKPEKTIKMSNGHVASNFTVVRPSTSLYSDEVSGHKTLAQKADMARTKHAARRQSEERTSGSSGNGVRVKDGYKSDDGLARDVIRHKASVRERIGSSRERDEERKPKFSRERSPISHSSVRDRVGVRDTAPVSVRDRLGGVEREPHSRHSPGDKKIYSRLGNRD